MTYPALLSATAQTARHILLAFIGITVILAYTPLWQGMPGAGLDPSWQYAMNEATAKGMRFGHDIIFTFGPYAAIYTKVYHPGTDTIALIGGFLIGICAAALLLILAKGTSLRWAFVYWFITVAIMYSRDPLFFSYPLLLSLVVYRTTLPPDDKYSISLPRNMELGFACLFLPLGLLSLTKGSYLVISVLISALCFTVFFRLGRKSLAYYSLAFPLASAIFFWLFSGQPISALPAYLFSLKQIISGYTEAMAVTGETNEIVYFLFAAIGVLYIIVTQKRGTRHSRLFLLTAVALILFVSFKGGFVRHDGHVIMASTMIIIVITLLNMAATHKRMALIAVLCLLAWFFADKKHINTSTAGIYGNIKNFYRGAKYGISDRNADEDVFYRRYSESTLAITTNNPIRSLDGTTDIYSFNQSHLIASGNQWAPRPIFQSYSAYTPELARLNEEHLYSINAPDNIIFRIEPIDSRLPALEDGRSWPAIITNYSSAGMENDFLYLEKTGVANIRPTLVVRGTGEHSFGSDILLPESNSVLFAEIEISKTLPGHLISFLFKPPQLFITLETTSGQKARFRIISGMTKSGFVISPLIENTGDFALLFDNSSRLTRKNVKSIKITPAGEGSMFWKDHFTLRLSELVLPAGRAPPRPDLISE